MFEIRTGDCLEVLRGMADSSVDSIVTDPPYGLSFMGKKWDYDVPDVAVWAECLRVLKPGGHLLAFAGTRTQHRMAVRIEDAGFEIRDMIAWVYGSGFPKSLDVSKAIDKAAGAKPTATGLYKRASIQGKPFEESYDEQTKRVAITAPATPAAQQWAGWGTALKPALEPITVARKPLIGTVAENVLQHGTGAINVDGCRVGDTVETWPSSRSYNRREPGAPTKGTQSAGAAPAGRWPANLIHDGSEQPTGLLGSAARFFYCAKASKRDREEGCEGLALVTHQSGMGGAMPIDDDGNARDRFKAQSRNHHPTVKPTDLMRYLCRLVTPPGGLVLDPFAGSGSTGKGALLEGFRFVGIERDPEYAAIAKARCAAVEPPLPLA